MTSFYLAARYGRRDEIAQYRDDLIILGYRSVADWLYSTDEEEQAIETDPERMARIALDDMAAIERSGLFVAFTEDPQSPHGRGGRHVELGYALCIRRYQQRLGQRPIRILIVGPRENIFCSVSEVERFETWRDALQALGEERT